MFSCAEESTYFPACKRSYLVCKMKYAITFTTFGLTSVEYGRRNEESWFCELFVAFYKIVKQNVS